MNSRSKWNSKHKGRLAEKKDSAPNPRLKNLSSYFHGGTALDLACGLGGNSMFLARMNYQVEAIDISDVAIGHIQEQAAKFQLNIESYLVDLTELDAHHFQKSPYDLVVITYYLDRSLFPIIKGLIKEDGYLFVETYYQSPQTENKGVSSQYKLEPKELLTVFGDWKVVFFEENEMEGRQTIFCQK